MMSPTRACSTIPPTLNCGSDSEPETGRRRSIWPWEFLSSATARRIGRLIALGLSTLSPKVSWSMKIWFSAVSFLLGENVVHVDRQRALGYRIAGVLGRVGREVGQLHVLGLGLDIDERQRGERIYRAADGQRRVAVDLSVEFDVGRRGRAGAEGSHLPIHLGEVGRVVGLDEVVGVVDLAAVKRNPPDSRSAGSGAGLGAAAGLAAAAPVGAGCGGRTRCGRWRGRWWRCWCRRRRWHGPGSARGSMRSRERGPRLLRTRRNVTQVQAAVGIENDARVKVAQVQRRDMDLRRARAQG